MSLHGSYWSLMEKKAREEDSFLIPRTQQQMRDKARNMKVDFLKYVPCSFPPMASPITIC